MWRDVPQSLASAAGAAAFAYDRLGNGRARVLREPRTVRYMHDEADLLERLLEERGVESAILVGHSDGASIALIHAGTYPKRVRALALLSPHTFVEAHSLRGIERARELYESTDLKRRLARWHEDPDATFYGWNRIWLDPAFASWNIRDCARMVCVPVLAIQGAADQYGTFSQLQALMDDVPAPVDVLHIARCGHNPLRDRADVTLSALGAFLRAAVRETAPS